MNTLNDTFDDFYPPQKYQEFTLGKTYDPFKRKINDEAGVFNLQLLKAVKDDIIIFIKPKSEQLYTECNNFSEISAAEALGFGISGKITYNTIAIECKNVYKAAQSSFKSLQTKKVYMYCLYKDAAIKLEYGETVAASLVSALRDTVLADYQGIVAEIQPAKKVQKYLKFFRKYGSGCITKLNLVSAAIAEISLEVNTSAQSAKIENQFSFGTSLGAKATISTVVDSLQTINTKVSGMKFTAKKCTFPSDSPATPWIDKLFTGAVENIQNKEWNKVVAPDPPTVNPVPPDIKPVTPAEKKSELDLKFADIDKKFVAELSDYKTYDSTKLLNTALLLGQLSAISKDKKQIDLSKERKSTSLSKISSDLSYSDKIDYTSYDIVCDTNISVLYNFAAFIKSCDDVFESQKTSADLILTKNIGATLLSTIIEHTNTELKRKMNVAEKSATEKQNIKQAAKVELKGKCTESQKVILEAVIKECNSAMSSGVIVMNDQDDIGYSIMESQMQNDCFLGSDLNKYTVELEEQKIRFNTYSIIDDIITIENSK